MTKRKFLPIAMGFIIIIFILTACSEKLTELQFENELIEIKTGSSHSINIITNLEEYELEDFMWDSEDPSVVDVQKGVINGVAEGSAVIRVSGENGLTATAKIIVEDIVSESIDILGDSIVMIGETHQLEVSFTPEDTTNQSIVWESLDRDIFEVDQEGKMQVVGLGIGTLTARTHNDITQSFEVESYIEIEEMTVENQSIRIEKNDTYQLEIALYPKEANENRLIYTSENDRIAAVDSRGLITAQSVGRAIVEISTVNGDSIEIPVTVFDIPVRSVSLNESVLVLEEGQTQKLTVKLEPADATDKSLTWSTTDSDVITISDGVIKAVGIGEAVITVETSNGKQEYVGVAVAKKAPVTLSNWRYTIDGACGVEWRFNVKNNTDKMIHYVTFSWSTMNAVGDPVTCDITRKSGYSVRYTGPLSPRSTDYNIINASRFYNCSYDYSDITRMVVEFSDGSTETIDSQNIDFYYDYSD